MNIYLSGRRAALLLITSCALLSACERPPIEATQTGYRGTGMALIANPRNAKPADELPVAQPPAAPGGPRAGEIYQNVKVLGDLSVGEFTRTMLAITSWVSPEEGCNYCHNPANLADDSKYTKVVSRRMIQMTQNVNQNWSQHVGAAGVTCYTCHRGLNVPANIWFDDTATDNKVANAGNRMGQNYPAAAAGLASLPSDPLSYYFVGDNLDEIGVNSPTWQPTGATGSIRKAEWTYSLMFHLSSGLGVNCNFCHNSRAFAAWDQSTPQRVTAWHGIRMVNSLNNDYLVPLGPVYPANRLGPTGDAPKGNCTTCHQGANKPLGGVNMVDAYPALKGT